MKKDRLYKSGKVSRDFSFDDKVAEVFDDMLDRSVPFYDAVIDGLIGLLSQRDLRGLTIYDLGCSTGTTLLELARRLPVPDCRFVGIDNAPAMIVKARRKAEMFSKTPPIHFREEDIVTAELENAGAIICNYTMQFIRPMDRLQFVRKLYDSLSEGGICIISEKLITHDTKLNRNFIEMHHRFKRSRGYTELEIAAKREALENVLIPYSIDENIDLLRQAGFHSVETFFQWFNFASFVALKQP